jgi:hypothetical protein
MLFRQVRLENPCGYAADLHLKTSVVGYQRFNIERLSSELEP